MDRHGFVEAHTHRQQRLDVFREAAGELLETISVRAEYQSLATSKGCRR